MRPYVMKDPEGNIFAEGMVMTDGRCFFSLLGHDYTFLYKDVDQLMKVHSANGNNYVEYDKMINAEGQEPVVFEKNEECESCDGSFNL